MKPSEFYEQYWRIKNANGEWISPPSLSQPEKDFLDLSMDNIRCQGVLFTRKRKRTVQVNAEILREEMRKFPPYFIPSNQPKLDKWGAILSENDGKLKT